jgi:hypothetical protein
MQLPRLERVGRLRKHRFGAPEEQEEWRARESVVEMRRLNEGLHDLWVREDVSGQERHRLMSDAVGEPL